MANPARMGDRRPAPVDVASLARAVSRYRTSPTEIEDLRRLTGGASRETWSFVAADPRSGTRERLVLRRDPGASLGTTDRSTEFRVLQEAGRAGVPVPRVRFELEPDDELGTGFVMDHVDGETLARRILRDDAYAAVRPELAGRCGEIAAAIHAIDPARLPPLPVQGATEQIEQNRALLDTFGEPHPAFEIALVLLAERIPAFSDGDSDRRRLVHGDFRNGNFVVGPDGIHAVLDWELAHLGDPVEDLGWLCGRSWRFGVDEMPVGGFGSYDDLRRAYCATSGRDVSLEHLRFWESMGVVRWGLITLVQGFAHLHGLVRSVELAAVGRRVAECEWDALTLIEQLADGTRR